MEQDLKKDESIFKNSKKAWHVIKKCKKILLLYLITSLLKIEYPDVTVSRI